MSDDNISSCLPTMCSNRVTRRVKLTDQQLEKASLEDLRRMWREQDLYIDSIESQATSQEADLVNLREAEERMRQQHLESTHREKVLVRRLATKEQEMQEYAAQIAEFKAGQTAGSSALRSALLDPAVNVLVQKLREEHLSTQRRLEETQNELSAWKFTPDSNTGKRLMAKCRLLYQENEELGRMISSGRLAKLEGELALQKSFSDEVKKSQSELDEFLQDLDEDVEGMQSTIYYLQLELKKSKEMNISLLQQQVNHLNPDPLVSEKHRVTAMKEQSPLPAAEIKSELEALSPKPPSPLEEDATLMASNDPRSPDTQVDIVEDEDMHDMPDKTECSDSGLDTGNEAIVAKSEIHSFMDNKIDMKDKVPKSEEDGTNIEHPIEHFHECSNDNEITDENKEDSDDPDSQGELMIEVGSEPRDSEDEESPEKTKEKCNLMDGVVKNGMMSRFDRSLEAKEEDNGKVSPPVHRKRPAPESSPNTSDEDSDDTPLIKKVRRNHEMTLKSKT